MHLINLFKSVSSAIQNLTNISSEALALQQYWSRLCTVFPVPASTARARTHTQFPYVNLNIINLVQEPVSFSLL